MEKFEINVPVTNPLETDEELAKDETPTVLNVESITVSALKKEFRYSESIRKETGIEGYERIKISWSALYDYLKEYISEIPNIDNEDDKREFIIKLSLVEFHGLAHYGFFKKESEIFIDGYGDYKEFYVSDFKKRVDEVIKEIERYSEITDTNDVANMVIAEIKELNERFQKESDELLELRALCLKREELKNVKPLFESYTELRLVKNKIDALVKNLPERDLLIRIDSCVKSVFKIIDPITKKVRDALILLLSTWSHGEFPKLTFNHVLSGDVSSPERRQYYKERLFKDDIFLQKIGIDGDSYYGSRFDLADGYLWDLGRSFLSEPSFGFDPNDATFINKTKSQGIAVDKFITDPNVKQWLSQVNNPGHAIESGYKNWFKSSGLFATSGHPSLHIPGNSEHMLRWGHAKYAIIPTDKNVNLITLEHKNEELDSSQSDLSIQK